MEMGIPMYDMYVRARSTLDSSQSSSLKQISYKINKEPVIDIVVLHQFSIKLIVGNGRRGIMQRG